MINKLKGVVGGFSVKNTWPTNPLATKLVSLSHKNESAHKAQKFGLQSRRAQTHKD